MTGCQHVHDESLGRPNGAERPLGTLSGGERQSVAIALAHELERPGG
ncbi:hypothetical protein [Blastococcus sp. DSM 46786]|nr:hypothetical protein [Blastococcus sp. DSM 46786]